MIHLRPLALGLATLAVLTVTGCSGSSRELGYKEVEIAEYQRQIKELEDQLFASDTKAVKAALPAGDVSTTDVQGAVGKNVTVSNRPVEVVLSIESEVLFKSGSASLNATAKSTLNKVVATINEKFPNHDIRVVGYTDDQKITRTRNDWNDNWDLSAGRAREVLLYIQGRGVSEKRLGLAGYGQERPLVPNTSSENRQKNRRVEIVVIPPAK
jgi:chemotaxis protein MotB